MDERILTSEKFHILGGRESLTHGCDAKIEVSIYPEIDKIKDDIEKLLELDNLEEILEERKKEEEEVYNEIFKGMQKWIEKAELTAICHRAMDYRKINKKMNKKDHTNNNWVQVSDYDNEVEISNDVYLMNCSIWEIKKYNYKKEEEEDVFYVTWDLWINGIEKHRIAGQTRKRYMDKEKAEEYLENRKKTYAHLFKKTTPLIPKKYKYLFVKNGVLLDGYDVEGEEGWLFKR